MGSLFDGILGSVISSGANITATEMTNKANRELAEYQYEQERQMVAEQNAYNSPTQQMARYAEAGLNPNLIYGNGVSSAGNQSTIAKYQAPRMVSPDIGNLAANAMNLVIAGLTAQKIKEDVKNRQEDNISKTIRNTYEKAIMQSKINQMLIKDKVFQQQLDNLILKNAMVGFDRVHQQEMYNEKLSALQNRNLIYGNQIELFPIRKSMLKTQSGMLDKSAKWQDANLGVSFANDLIRALGGIVGMTKPFYINH